MIEELRNYNQKSTFNPSIPNPDKPEPNRFEDKKIDCDSEFSARKNAKIITKVLNLQIDIR
jgi:hypothetical protein